MPTALELDVRCVYLLHVRVAVSHRVRYHAKGASNPDEVSSLILTIKSATGNDGRKGIVCNLAKAHVGSDVLALWPVRRPVQT